MRNPGQKALLWLLVMAAGIVLLSQTFSPDRITNQGWPTYAMIFAGIMMTMFGLVYALWALILLVGRARLLAGHRRLGQWHVSADEWRRFVAFDAIRAGSAPNLANDFKPSRQNWDNGIDVIVGETSILVGDFYQPLRRGGLPGLLAIYWLPEPADPQCLEFHVFYPRRSGPGRRLCVRAPIARSAIEEARRVYDHFEPLLRPKPSIALRNPPLTIAICLALALVFAGIAAWGFSRAGNGIQDDAAMFAAIIGTIIAPAALILALVTFLLSRRRAP